MTAPTIALLIPAYRPSPELPDVIREVLNAGTLISHVIVVDDGNAGKSSEILRQTAAIPHVTVIRHAVNLGKGAALKSGFNHILVKLPEITGIVTADADGQHAVNDIVLVAERLAASPERLVLGTRRFSRDVPLRSRLGNIITRYVFALFTGKILADTQTGLRGWPLELCRESLRVPINGYDFELEALVRARSAGITEVPVQTIYVNGNRSSHFNPLRDSLRIYFVFLRYCGSSLMVALVDSTVFSVVYTHGGNLAVSQAAGRVVAVAGAFFVLRSLVFHSTAGVGTTVVRYLALVAVMGYISYTLIGLLHEAAPMPVLPAKLLVEFVLFLGNFAIQRQFIFVRE